jgi:plasmid stabilization system protein ParE
MTVRASSSAIADLRAILDEAARLDERAGRKLRKRVRAALKAAGRRASAGEELPGIGERALRQATAGGVRIVYTTVGERVHLVAVLPRSSSQPRTGAPPRRRDRPLAPRSGGK